MQFQRINVLLYLDKNEYGVTFTSQHRTFDPMKLYVHQGVLLHLVLFVTEYRLALAVTMAGGEVAFFK